MIDPSKIDIVERCVIRKYDGDAPLPGEAKAPVETIISTRKNGQLVAQEIWGPNGLLLRNSFNDGDIL